MLNKSLKKFEKYKISIVVLLVFCFFSNSLIINAASTLFEGIGRYEFVTAGNNNASRGLFVGDSELILSYPENWETIEDNIPLEIQSKINNISGSRLDFNGTLKKAYLTYNVIGTANFEILLIKPDGSYKIYHNTATNGHIDISSDINESGWYYVAYLAVANSPHQAWAITAICENNDTSIKYLKLSKVGESLSGTTPPSTTTFYFNSKLTLKNNFQLYGVIVAAGVGGWDSVGATEDSAEVILSDGSYMFLSESLYNGQKVFEGRQKTEFARGIFNTIRSHNMLGGELDIFLETLSTDYFGGKEPMGYRFTKIGSNIYYIHILGLTQEIESPELQIDPIIKLDKTNKVNSSIKVYNNGTLSACNTKLSILIDDNIHFSSISDINLSDTNNIDYQLDENNREILVTFNKTFNSSEEFEIEFNSQRINIDEEVTLETAVYYFPSADNDCVQELLDNPNYEIKNMKIVSEIYSEENQNEPSIENPQTGIENTIIFSIIIAVSSFTTYIYLKNKKSISI